MARKKPVTPPKPTHKTRTKFWVENIPTLGFRPEPDSPALTGETISDRVKSALDSLVFEATRTLAKSAVDKAKFVENLAKDASYALEWGGIFEDAAIEWYLTPILDTIKARREMGRTDEEILAFIAIQAVRQCVEQTSRMPRSTSPSARLNGHERAMIAAWWAERVRESVDFRSMLARSAIECVYPDQPGYDDLYPLTGKALEAKEAAEAAERKAREDALDKARKEADEST